MTAPDTLASLCRRLDVRASYLRQLDAYYTGLQPLAFLSADARSALGTGYRTLAVNFPKLVVNALAERLQVVGFRVGTSDDDPDDDLWRAWLACGMSEGADQAHVETLTLGSSFVIVWGRKGRPVVSVESARQTAALYDPATREVTAAAKRWAEAGKGWAYVYEPDVITKLVSTGTVADWLQVPPDGWVEMASYTPDGWQVVEEISNPLGVVPVVPLVNRAGRLMDLDGISEMADVLNLTDALNKVMSDAMVTSEFYARPRRWVTGLEIQEDADGNAINPFASAADRVWQSEDAQTKFGQFDGAQLDSYESLIATITQQIGALTGLPPHYLGLHGDQPASADAIRSSEASLVARARARQRVFGSSWSRVGALMLGVRDGIDPTSVDVEPVWADAETRTPAQAADASSKLVAAGIIPVEQAQADLGYTPTQIENMRGMRLRASIDTVAANLGSIAV